jgi:hypothetical protein
VPEPDPAPASDPEHAWRVLTLVNDWVRHAETKIGATLAATGVTGGVLFTLIRGRPDRSLTLEVTAAVCGALILLAGVLAGLALLPRLRAKPWRSEPPTSPLYFAHIARRYRGVRAAEYPQVLAALSVDADALTREIGCQVRANAGVAHRKHRLTHAAILSLLLALLALVAVAVVIVQKW